MAFDEIESLTNLKIRPKTPTDYDWILLQKDCGENCTGCSSKAEWSPHDHGVA